MENLKKEQIMQACINQLTQALPRIAITYRVNGQKDDIIEINGIEFASVVMPIVSKSTYLTALNKLRCKHEATQQPVLLLCNSVSSEILQQAPADGFGVVESSGNCNIMEGNLALCVFGRKREREEIVGCAFKETGIKLVYHFLIDKNNIAKSYRKINAETGISLGAITNIVEELKRQNFVAMATGRRILINRTELLNQWQQNYNNFLKPKLLIGKMRFRDNEAREQWKHFELPPNSYWAGEGAANKIDGFIQPEQFTIYTNARLQEFIRAGKMLMDSNGEISVYKVFWNAGCTGDIVNNVITYADLMGSGHSRCLEAAQRILANEI